MDPPLVIIALLLVLALSADPAPLAQACPGPRSEASPEGASSIVVCAGGSEESLQGPARLLFGLRLDPDREPAASLEVLPGLGPVRAAALAAHVRDRPLCSVRDLESVPGIGPHTAGRIAPFLDLGRDPRCADRDAMGPPPVLDSRGALQRRSHRERGMGAPTPEA